MLSFESEVALELVMNRKSLIPLIMDCDILRSLGLALAALAFIGTSLGEDEIARSLWEQEAMLLYSESSSKFTNLRMGRKNIRLSSYATALELMHDKVKPEEEGVDGHEAARALFTNLVGENGDDPVAMASRYYLARITEFYAKDDDDRLKTKDAYLSIFEMGPDRFFGQFALVKYATLEIYDGDPTPDIALNRIQLLEPFIERISFPDFKRNLHRILGEAYMEFDLDPQLAYEHLKNAYDMGVSVELIRIDVLIALGELCERLGKKAEALSSYDELLGLLKDHDRLPEFRETASRLRAELADDAI